MSAQYSELIEILEREHALLNNFERLLNNEKECLSNFDREGLDRCNNALETLSLQMDVLEQSRRMVLSELARQLNIPPQETSLALLAQQAPQPHGRRLSELRDAIVESSGAVRKMQDQNRILILNGLKMVQGVRKVIEDSINPKLTYSPAGRKPDGKIGSVSGGRRI